MDGAWIAVIGTLGGVVVTATSALVVSIVTTRSQRATADRQIAVAAAERLRTDNRERQHRCTNQLWDLADAAAAGEQEKFATEKAAGKQLRHDLRAAMRADLNV